MVLHAIDNVPDANGAVFAPLVTGLPGENSAWEPPDSIPNSEVKLRSADDSAASLWCESRSSPGSYSKTPAGLMTGGGFFWALGWRAIESIPEGVSIMSRPIECYASNAANRSARLRLALGQQWAAVPIHVFETLPSTSGWMADRALNEPTLVIADEQTQGRGRQGRAWHSPAGGIYFSIGLPIPASARPPDALSLAVGLQLAETLIAAGFSGIGIKWPNDLVVDDAKLAGLLVERFPNALVVGVGVNTESLPNNAAVAGRPIVGLRQLGDRTIDDALIGRLAGAVLDVTTWTAMQVEWVLQSRWPVFDALAERTIVVEQADGARLQGRARGVTAAGNLRLQTGTGEHVLSAGECHIGRRRGAAS